MFRQPSVFCYADALNDVPWTKDNPLNSCLLAQSSGKELGTCACGCRHKPRSQERSLLEETMSEDRRPILELGGLSGYLELPWGLLMHGFGGFLGLNGVPWGCQGCSPGWQVSRLIDQRDLAWNCFAPSGPLRLPGSPPWGLWGLLGLALVFSGAPGWLFGTGQGSWGGLGQALGFVWVPWVCLLGQPGVPSGTRCTPASGLKSDILNLVNTTYDASTAVVVSGSPGRLR